MSRIGLWTNKDTEWECGINFGTISQHCKFLLGLKRQAGVLSLRTWLAEGTGELWLSTREVVLPTSSCRHPWPCPFPWGSWAWQLHFFCAFGKLWLLFCSKDAGHWPFRKLSSSAVWMLSFEQKKEKQLMMCKFGLYSGRLFIQTIVEEEAVKILIREKSLKEKGVTWGWKPM